MNIQSPIKKLYAHACSRKYVRLQSHIWLIPKTGLAVTVYCIRSFDISPQMDILKQRNAFHRVDALAPARLFKQIVLMQLFYYCIGLILIAFTYVISGHDFNLYVVFSWEPVRFDTTMGWTLSLLWLLDTFFSVLALSIIVGRSKLALDFTLTLHGIHVLITWAVTGRFPVSLLWWMVQGVSMLIMVSLGTWVSQWRELRTTFFESYELLEGPKATESGTETVGAIGAKTVEARGTDTIGTAVTSTSAEDSSQK